MRYSSLENLKNNPPHADIYMTGSDQVWGPVSTGVYDSAYFLSYVPDQLKKIAEVSEELISQRKYYKNIPNGYQDTSMYQLEKTVL